MSNDPKNQIAIGSPSNPISLDIRKSPDFFTLYSNTLRVNVSLSDVSIVFGELKEEFPGNTFVEDQLTIQISHSQAKVLMNILSESTAVLEEFVGEIKVPGLLTKETYRENTIPRIREVLKAALELKTMPSFKIKKS